MKKTLTILAILAVALVAMMGSVNAATVSVQPTNVQVVNPGETVTITIKMDQPSKGFSCVLHYPAEIFDFEDADCMVNSSIAGQVNIGVLDVTGKGTAQTATIKLKVKESQTINTTQTFNVSDIDISNTDNDDQPTSGQLIITTTPEGPTPGEGTTTPEGKPANPEDTQSTPVESEGPVVGTDGKVITRIPQTGAPVFIGAGVLLVVAGTLFAVKKLRK